MLNLGLMRHWENWATILLMIIIATFAINMAAKLIHKEGN